ncbi:MAG: type II secretion system protein [Phycisphaerales bacterium JB037]
MRRLPAIQSLRRGFTLIEILIAIVILSLGLLGLAAIFPVVVFQQRIATDQAQGGNAAEAAETFLRRNASLHQRNADTTIQDDRRGFEWLRVAESNFVDVRFEPLWSPFGEWETPNETDSFMTIDPRTGLLTIEAESGGLPVEIPVAQRLIPAPYAESGEPIYVWDVAMRRVITESDRNGAPKPTRNDAIEVAVFVNRVDSGIEVPTRFRDDANQQAAKGRRLRLSDVLVQDPNELVPREFAVPVSVEQLSGENDGIGRPRKDGAIDQSGNRRGYAVPFTIAVATSLDYDDPTEIERNRIELDLSGRADARVLFELASQPGQRLVDGQGNLYTVVRADETAANTVIVRPPVPSSIQLSDELREVVLTPKVPVSVRLFRVQP